MFKGYYDPHYKPNRTPEKYKADERRDRRFAAENAAFVEEFLMNWTRQPTRENPAEAFKAMRIEARRLAHAKPSKGLFRTYGPVQVIRAKQKIKTQNTRYAPQFSGFPKARFERASSQRYLLLKNEELMSEYVIVQSKIEKWRAEHEVQVDQVKKAQLAEQLQIQYVKRRDLIALIGYRLQE